MATNPFQEWLSEVVADKIVIALDEINTEAEANMWSFSLTSEQAAAIAPDQVEMFIREVAEAGSKQIDALGCGSMLFYCWHDEMAAQLLFSLVSTSHAILPFGCPIERVADLGLVVRDFLSSTYHDGIPWSEFEIVTHPSQTELDQIDEESAQRMSPLRVWSQELPLL
jgi:hypothetical protein